MRLRRRLRRGRRRYFRRARPDVENLLEPQEASDGRGGRAKAARDERSEQPGQVVERKLGETKDLRGVAGGWAGAHVAMLGVGWVAAGR